MTDEIDGPRGILGGVGQSRQRLRRLLEEIHRLDERRSGSSISAGLPEVRSQPCPTLRPAPHDGPAAPPAHQGGPAYWCSMAATIAV